MKNFKETLIEVLLDRAESEQNVANRLYKGHASNESYLVATVTAQVLRNVAQAHEQAENIFDARKKGNQNINSEFHKGMLKNFDTTPLSPPNISDMKGVFRYIRGAEIDPDLFREKFRVMIDRIDDLEAEGIDVPDTLLKLAHEGNRALDHHPISPARQVQSKYEGYLEECRQMLGMIKHRIDNDIEIKNTGIYMDLVDSLESLKSILKKGD